MKELISVTSENTHYIVCGNCDQATVETKKWYRKVDDNGQKYLDCCKDKVGSVVDWEEV